MVDAATDKFHGTLAYGFSTIDEKSKFSVRVVRPPSNAQEKPDDLWGMILDSAREGNYFPADNGAIATEGEIFISGFNEEDPEQGCKAKTSFKLRAGNVLEEVNGWAVKGENVKKVIEYIKMAIKKCSATYPIDFRFRRHDYHAALEEIKLFVDEVKAMEEEEPKGDPPPVKMVKDMDEKQRRAAMRRACGALGVDPEQEYHIVNSIIEDVVNVSSSLSSNGWEAYVFDEVIWYWNTKKNDICAEHPTRLVCSSVVKDMIAKSVFTCISIQRRWRFKVKARAEQRKIEEDKKAKEREAKAKADAEEQARLEKKEKEEEAARKAELERLDKEKKAVEAKEAKAAEEKKKKEAELKRIEEEKKKKEAAEAKKKAEIEAKKKADNEKRKKEDSAALKIQNCGRVQISKRKVADKRRAENTKHIQMVQTGVDKMDRAIDIRLGLCEQEMDLAIMKKQEEEKVAMLRMTANVQVAVRVRPLNDREKNLRAEQGIPEKDWLKINLQHSFDVPGAVNTKKEKDTDEATPCDIVKLSNGGLPKPDTYSFDYCFDPTTQQKYLYDQAMRKSVDGFLLGFNCTIFAYGQTGSGKTWSMFGDIHSETKAGVIPRACDHIFAYVEAHGISMGKDEKDGKMGKKDKVGHRSSVMSRLNVQKNVDFELNMTYVEIYRERVNDLLDPSKKDLKLKEVKGADGKASITIEDATEKKLLNKEDVMAALEIGGKNRATMSTGMNAESSRSHCLVIFNLVKITGVSRKKTMSRLNLIDLAGSERIKKTNVSGDMLEEAKAINGSLSALGQCIKALASSDNGKKKSGHVPFRDSKLTRLLQHSLIGNSRTLLLVGISPHEDNVDETRSTLGFAARAKLIKTSLSMSLAAADGDVKVVRSIDEIEAEMAKIKEVRDKNLKEFKETFRAIEANKNAKAHRETISKHETLFEKVAEALPFDSQNVLDEDKAAKEAKEKKNKAKVKSGKSSSTGKPSTGKNSSMHMKKGRDGSTRSVKGGATKGGGTSDKKGKGAKKPPAPPLKGSGRKGK